MNLSVTGETPRRARILQAALEAIAEYGVSAVTHRKIAQRAEVPLGSLTYYFTGIDALLEEALSGFAREMSQTYQAYLAQATSQREACEALTKVICGAQITTPENMELMYQLYAYASRRPALKTIMQEWMQRSQQILEVWFDPVTARALDAFIEGMTLHYVVDRKPLSEADIRGVVLRLAGIA